MDGIQEAVSAAHHNSTVLSCNRRESVQENFDKGPSMVQHCEDRVLARDES